MKNHAILRVVFWLVCLVASFSWGRFLQLADGDQTRAWTVAGDVVRNSSGILAVLAASIAAWIAHRTNRTRREEANRANFKDRMQWAVNNSRSEEDLAGALAEELIYSLEKDESLAFADLSIAQRIAAQHKEQQQKIEKVAQVYENLLKERQNLLITKYNNLSLDYETTQKIQQLTREYRVLFMKQGVYNRDIQFMLLADKIQEIIQEHEWFEVKQNNEKP